MFSSILSFSVSGKASDCTVSRYRSLTATIVGTSFAVFTICDSSGSLRCVSHIMRIGFTPPSILHVSSGSSASTVPIPAIMALYLWRRFCTCSLAFSPVIHFESPEYVAIFPSIVMAYFIATYGRLVCIK